MQEQMFGVVLWADASDHKAVIWCEDHGNLAYYTGNDTSLHGDIDLDAGDLIQFDLREERDMRHARNLRRVDAGHAPSIVHDLKQGQQSEPLPRRTPTNVVSFPQARRAG